MKRSGPMLQPMTRTARRSVRRLVRHATSVEINLVEAELGGNKAQPGSLCLQSELDSALLLG